MYNKLFVKILKIFRWLGDSAKMYQLGFQDPVTTTIIYKFLSIYKLCFNICKNFIGNTDFHSVLLFLLTMTFTVKGDVILEVINSLTAAYPNLMVSDFRANIYEILGGFNDNEVQRLWRQVVFSNPPYLISVDTMHLFHQYYYALVSARTDLMVDILPQHELSELPISSIIEFLGTPDLMDMSGFEANMDILDAGNTGLDIDMKYLALCAGIIVLSVIFMK